MGARVTIHPLAVQILDAQVKFSHQPFIRPLVLSTGTIHTITQADATVRVRVADREATGHGCIYLSDAWAWPDPALAHPLRLSIDSNEANPDAQSVLAYLEALERMDPLAYQALETIEQPTGRDIAAAAFDWRDVARRKPVMVDEGLLSFDAMALARAQGWSGFALKTCKGHSFALVAAAWAIEHGMTLCLQDLTNPGLAAIHAALFAAHVPTLNGVELNASQFTPAANESWHTRVPGLFEVTDGQHRLPRADIAGLGGGL